MDLKTRIVITTKDKTKAGNASVKSGLGGIDQQLNTLRRNLIATFSIAATALFVRSLAKVADEYKEINARIRLATTGQDAYNKAQKELFAISQRTRTALATNAELFNRINRSTKQLGGTQERSLRLTELINKAAKIGGENAQTQNQAIRQLNQGLASGVLRGEEYNSVLEGTTRLAKAIADGLGVTIGQLREMAEAGELTTAKVLVAIESQAAIIKKEFGGIPVTISAALVTVENAWVTFIGKLDEGAGTSASISEAFLFIGENLSALIGTLLRAGAIFATVYGAKAVLKIKTYVTAQLASAAAAKAELTVANALSVAKLHQATINLKVIQSEIAKLRIAQKSAKTDAARIAIIKQLNAALAGQAVALSAVAAAEKTYTVATTLATRATRIFNKAFKGLIFIAIASEVIAIAREWSTEFDLWAIVVEGAVSKVITTIGHFLSGDFLDDDADTLDKKLAAIDDKFGQMFINAQNGTVSASNRAAAAFGGLGAAGENAAGKLDEAFKQVKKALDDQAKAQKVALDRQLADIDVFAAEAANKFARAYTSEIDVARAIAEQLISINDEKTTAIVDHFGQQIAIVSAAYDKEIAATKRKNLNVVGLERDLRNAKKAIYIELESALSDSVKNLLDIERGHIERSKSLSNELIEHQRAAAKNLRDLESGSESNAQAQINRQKERARINQQLAEADAALKKKNFGEALELSKKAEKAALELAKTEKSAAEEGRSYDVDALAAKNTYKEAVDLVDEALVGLQKSEEDAAATAKSAAEEQAQSLDNVRSIIDDIDKKLAATKQLKIDVDVSQIDAAIARINAIPSTKFVTIIERTIQANKTGGAIRRLNTGGFLPKSGKLSGFGGGDKVKALLEPGEFIIRKEAVQAYGQGFIERINAIKEPIKRRLGGIIPRFAGGGAISNSVDIDRSVGNQVGARLGIVLDVDSSQLESALRKLEDKIRDQVESAQQRFNESVLKQTDRATELTAKALKNYGDQLARIQKDATNFDDSIDDRIRRIKRAGFTEEERRVDIIKQIREKQRAAEQAIAEGDLERAARLNSELISLAESISVEVRDAGGNVIVSQTQAAQQAIAFLNQAKRINNQIVVARKANQLTIKNTELADIQATKNAKIAAIQAELGAKLAAIEKARLAELAAINERATRSSSGGSSRSSGSSSSVFARGNQVGGGALSGRGSGVSGGGSRNAQAGELRRQIALQKSSISRYESIGSLYKRGADKTVVAIQNLQLKLQQLQRTGSIDGAKQRSKIFYGIGGRPGPNENDLKRSVKTTTQDLARAVAIGNKKVVDTLNERLNGPNGFKKQLEKKQGFAIGGSVPGSGDGDTVDALLTPGEFVMRKSAVQQFGSGFMNAVNRGVLPSAKQRFAAGGKVRSVKESIAITLNVGGSSAQGQFDDNASTAGLIAELKEAGLVA